MVGERGGRRQRVLDRRQLLDLGRRPRPIAVVQVIAEEVLVVLVVPAVGLFLVGRFLLLLFRCGLDRLELLGGNFLQHRVLDHFLVEELRQLERRHGQELDRLLQRRRQNQLLDELGVKFLRDRHESVDRRLKVQLRPPVGEFILIQPEVGPQINPAYVLIAS
jgi:hypothetical protein